MIRSAAREYQESQPSMEELSDSEGGSRTDEMQQGRGTQLSRHSDTIEDEDEYQDSYEGYWSIAMEKSLRKSWSAEDEFLLDQSKEHNEAPLWARCHALFGITPPEILPYGVKIDTKRNPHIQTEDGTVLENSNWSQKVCVAFGKVLLCPPFQQDLHFFRYIIKYVLFLRCGKEGGRKEPDLLDYSGNLAEDIVRDLSDMITGAGRDAIRKKLREGIPGVKRRIEARYGTRKHPHLGLTEALREIVQPGYHLMNPQLTVKDFEWVIKAWNIYADANELPKTAKAEIPSRKGTLPKGNEERRAAIEIRNFDFRAVKKAYILDLRRDIFENKKIWCRGRHDLFGEALEVGRSYASSDIGHDLNDTLSRDDLLNMDGNSETEVTSDEGGGGSSLPPATPDIGKGIVHATLKRHAPEGQGRLGNKKKRMSAEEDEAVDEQHGLAAAAVSNPKKTLSINIHPKATPSEIAEAIWNDITPGFTICVSADFDETSHTGYLHGIKVAVEYWTGEMGLSVWPAINKEVRKLLIDQVTNSTVLFNSFQGDDIVNDIRANLHKLIDRMVRMRNHYNIAERLRKADVDLVSGPRRRTGSMRWEDLGLPIKYVSPENFSVYQHEKNDFAFDNRPGTSRNCVILAKTRSQMKNPNKTYLLQENELTFEKRIPFLGRVAFPPDIIFGPDR